METTPLPIKKNAYGRLFFLIGLAGLFLFAASGVVASAYLRPPTAPFTRAVASRLPLPAFSLNGERVTINEFLTEYDALVSYYAAVGEGAALPEGPEFLATLVDTLLNRTALVQLAAREGVSADAARVDEIARKMAEDAGGEEEFARQVLERFGWSTDEFRKRVIDAVVLAEQMEEHVAEDEALQADSRSGIERALARLAQGEAFETVAGEESEDFSAAEGGNIGFVPLASIPQSWQDALAPLEAGQTGSAISMPDAFVIVRLNERTAGEDAQVDLSLIVTRKKTLGEAVEEFLAGSEIKRYIAKTAQEA